MTTKRYIAFSIISLLIIGSMVSFVYSNEDDASRGWFWSAAEDSGSGAAVGLGWASTNCLNDFDNDGILDNRCLSQVGIDIGYGIDVTLSGGEGNPASYPTGINGCSWSDTFGWICFSTDALVCPAATPGCNQLSAGGVAVVETSAGSGVYVAKHTPGSSPAADERAAILSLVDPADPARGYLAFPFDPASSVIPGSTWSSGSLVSSCVECDPTTNDCKACLLVDEGVSNVSNYLCTGCTNCTVNTPGGSCATGHVNTNTCDITSCSVCYSKPGAMINYPRACRQTGQYCNDASDCSSPGDSCDFVNSHAEMCGWGYNSWSPNSVAVPWYNNQWSNRIKLTIDKSRVSGIQNDFPVYVKLSRLPASFFSTVQADGGDIVITTDDGVSVVPRELVELNVGTLTGELYFLANISDVVNKDFYIYYGNPSANVSNSQATWNSNYQLVWHLNSDPASGVVDSAGSNNGTAINGLNSSDLVTGYLNGGTGLDFDFASSQYIAATGLGSYSNFTIEAWLKLDQDCQDIAPNGNCVVWGNNDGANWWILRPTSEYIEFASNDNMFQGVSTSSNINTWAHVAVTKSNDVISYYRSGQLVASRDNSSPNTPNEMNVSIPFAGSLFGHSSGNNFGGVMDEIRVSNTALSASRLLTQQNSWSQTDTFLSIGSVETPTTISDTSGLGWVALNPILGGSAKPYVSTEQGNVYSDDDIYGTLAPPYGKYNGSYLIDARGNITNWQADPATGQVRPNLSVGPSFPAFDTQGNATSTLGTLDIFGLITPVISGSATNKYGSALVNAPNGTVKTLNNMWSEPLNDRVYLFTGQPTWDVSGLNKVVQNGSAGNPKSGAGIIYIEGDLNIDTNITYNSIGITTRLAHIPSLVWIVKGDVIVDPSVTEVAGSFLVLGDGTDCPLTVGDPFNPSASNSCGRFSSGDDSSLSNTSGLILYGNVIARQLNLQRSYTDNGEPSERFIADGRLQANTPSGLTSFSQSIPKFGFSF